MSVKTATRTLRGTGSLAASYVRRSFRSRTSLFWNFAFPLFWLFAFAFIFADGESRGVSLLMPGLLAITILAISFSGVSYRLVRERERGTLRRYHVTPVRATAVVLANAFSSLVILLIALVLLGSVAWLVFRIQVVGGLADLVLVLLVGSIAFVPLGLVVGGMAPSTEAAPAVNNAIFFPLIFVSGAALPFATLPDWIQAMGRALPPTYLVEALQRVMIRGEAAVELGGPLLVLLVTAVVGAAISSLLFRWESGRSPGRGRTLAALGGLAVLCGGVAALAPPLQIAEQGWPSEGALPGLEGEASTLAPPDAAIAATLASSGSGPGHRVGRPPSPAGRTAHPWFCDRRAEGVDDPGSREADDRVPPPDAPSRDLYCVDLLPTPRAAGASGTLQLAPADTPFGAPLARDGRFRFEVSARVRGLPDPASLGDYRTYVAWAAGPAFRPFLRLGEVGRGTRSLGSLDLNKFLVLVTAERSTKPGGRRGPVVLRARSPSMRLQPHDLPFGFMRGDPPGPDPGREAGGAGKPAEAGDPGWTPPPMHPGVPMSPPVASLRPSTAPFLPAEGRPDGSASEETGPAVPPPARSELPRAHPGRVARLGDGDTLRFVAGRVRRSLQGGSHLTYGFNGLTPGPLLRVPRDAEITVLFRNDIDLPSTIHWHGLRIENGSDGVPGITQPPVPPGGSFTYRLRFPDPGIYWYHPHVREDVQQDLGLYGNILVEPRGAEGELPIGAREAADRAAAGLADPLDSLPPPAGLRADPASADYSYGGAFGPVNREEFLALDDLLVAPPAGGSGRARPVPYGADVPTHALMGRFGNLFLVNGEPRYERTVTAGEVVRFYLTNVASTRVFNLSFGDLPLKVVASDLSRYERPARAESAVLGPAERYVVEVLFDEPGEVPLLNRVQALDHVHGEFFPVVDTLGTIRVRPGEPERSHADRFAEHEPNPAVRRDVERYREAFDGPVDRTLHLTMELDPLPFPVGSLIRRDSFYFHPLEASGTMPRMNWVTTASEVRWILRDPETGRENMEIDWRFRVGQIVKIRLRNLRHAAHAMQHPIHLHGQRFLVLSRNGRRSQNLGWKDTTIVPVGTTATLLVELTNPGEWMLHCHIAEHLGSGMRTVFTVDAGGPDG